jgi:hypothetical protein
MTWHECEKERRGARHKKSPDVETSGLFGYNGSD